MQRHVKSVGVRTMCSAALFSAVLSAVALSASAAETFVSKDDSQMLLVPAGPFPMGAHPDTEDTDPDETPEHAVDVADFYMDKHEITVAQYARFVEETGHQPPVDWIDGQMPAHLADRPITNVSWFDAMEYAIWAGKRLPTEAEWEKAAAGFEGQRFPWGNEDDKGKRNLKGKQLEPVGSRPEGASPFGILQMSGNVREWTASWYEPYPETTASTVQFGHEYKVARGGSSEYYYAKPNHGTTTSRTPVLPYGAHDYIGFRCARSVRADDQPYDPEALLAEAQQLLDARLEPPSSLPYDADFEAMLKRQQIKLTAHGEGDHVQHVRVGVPFPKSLLNNAEQFSLTDADGRQVALQQRTLATWSDESIRWCLFDFLARPGQQVTLSWGEQTADQRDTMLVDHEPGEHVTLDTGAVRVGISRHGLIDRLETSAGEKILSAARLRVEVESVDRSMELAAAAADEFVVEEAGPVHVVILQKGILLDSSGHATDFHYTNRISATRGVSRVNVQVTLTHMVSRASMSTVKDWSVHIIPSEKPSRVRVADDTGVKELEAPANLILVNQTTATEYAIHRDDEVVGTGTFCPGWLQIMTGDHWLQLGVRHFRQNHPRTLFVSRRSLGARFWAGEAFEWEGGLAKTAEFVLDYSTEPASSFGLTPIRAAAPPAWTCGSQALGAPLLPRSRTALARFGYWEAKRVARMREWCRAMPTGFRHYGDAYYGGPYKGKNAYMNLEYDVHFNFLMESLRSGQTWFINAAETMARHQADIDTDHHSGQPWKHSPRHTLTRADFGHVFVRGLLLYHLMSGDQHSLDVAQEIGAWLALKVSRDQGVGNERQIGWSLYGLTGLYEVTRDAKYLDAAEHLCDRLVRGQKPTGQFDIRYDNRISFFNGIAMNGMLTVAEHTQDDALKNAILKVANRTLGMYPEYACRTLNAFSWAARETNDPRFIDVLERTWELSMQYLKNGSSTSETYAWQFRDFAARHDLCPMFEETPAVMPAAESWLTTRCTQPEVTAFVRVVSDAPAAVMVVLEGLTTGRIDVQTLEGKSVISKTLGSQTRLFQAGSFELTGQGQVYQIKMASDDALAWQVHHDADSHVVFYDPTGRLIPELYPAAFGSRTEAEAPVVVTLEAQGEGFHKASLYDPAGHPVTTLTHFIDFQDEQTYDLELKAEPEGPMTGWSLEVYHSHVSSVSGMKPYWSATADQWFEPDQP